MSEKKPNEVTSAALFNQVLAMMLPDEPTNAPMKVDKVIGEINWWGVPMKVKAYRVFSRAKGHPNDMVRVDLTLGG